MYQNFVRVVDQANVIISTYQSDDMGELMCDPSSGNVAFGSGKEQWAFTLSKFARIYSKKFNTDFAKMMEKLWGDNFFCTETKKWKKEGINEDGKPIRRAFAQFIMDPICKLCNAIIEGRKEDYEKMLTVLGIKVTTEQKLLEGKPLLKSIMSKWLSAADCLL